VTNVSKAVAVLCLLGTGVVSLCAPREKAQTISGRIVANFVSLACLNGNGYYSVIIELEKPLNNEPGFIEMHFTQPCGHNPEWLHSKSEFKPYRLKRADPRDIVVEEFMTLTNEGDGTSTPIPAWTYLPGAEVVKLPFGERIPSYRSGDLPFVPVM
jgi:hypothetical protein